MKRVLLALVAMLLLVSGVYAQDAAPSGTIVLYTSESEDNVNEMVADFNEQFPDVEIEIFRSGSGEVVARLQAELEESGDILADVIWFADIDFFRILAEDDMMLSYRPQLPADLTEEEVAEVEAALADLHYGDDEYHEVRLIFNVVAYNTMLVEEAPTSWNDLLNADFNGLVAMPSALYSGAAFNQVGTLANREDFGWDFYNQLNDNGVIVGQGNGGIAQGLANGEYAMVQVVDFMARAAKNEGSPVDHIWPEEGAVLVPTPIGILADTENPEAAQAFLDYMYTESAQQLFVDQGYIPVMPGAPLPEGTPDIADLSIITVDTGYIGENREDIRATFEELFGAPAE